MYLHSVELTCLSNSDKECKYFPVGMKCSHTAMALSYSAAHSSSCTPIPVYES